MIRLSPDAESDLLQIAAWIGQDRGRNAAERVTGRIAAAIERLVSFAGLGRLGRVPGTFELAVGGLPYIVVYETSSDDVLIVRILHTRLSWPPDA